MSCGHCVPECCHSNRNRSEITEHEPHWFASQEETLTNASAALKVAQVANVAANAAGNALAEVKEAVHHLADDSDAAPPDAAQETVGHAALRIFGLEEEPDDKPVLHAIQHALHLGPEEDPAVPDNAPIGEKVKAFAHHELVQVRHFVKRSHFTVQSLSLIVAVGLAVISVLGMANFLDAGFSKRFQYVHSVYNILFAGLIIIMDGHPKMFGKMQYLQDTLYKAAPCLSRQKGKAMVHFYVGSISLCFITTVDEFIWKVIYLSTGGALCFVGVIMMFNHCCCHCGSKTSKRHSHSGDYGASAVVAGVHDAQEAVKEECVEIQQFIRKNPFSVRILCFILALGLLGTSVLGCLAFWEAIFDPFNYMQAGYNVLFAMLIVVIDGPAGMFKRCGDSQTELFHKAPILASQVGRAGVHFYVGSVNFVMMDGAVVWNWIYEVLGGVLMLCAVVMLLHFNWCSGKLPSLTDLTEPVP
eukprot:TRINITY_DN13186_c2_g1_i1.p1 TRINITY_DN13186_c2_g1~~TRINITY_DN13186_c2_g1_i1.p1  ORF type:complete len:497 (+),score=75.92 TRINITY_DN13186_c2_g1_i1:81-1493(+)